MLKIEMESSTKNYLVRLLENYKEYIQKNKFNQKEKEYELNQISIATSRLMGIKPGIALNKNLEPINFGLTED